MCCIDLLVCVRSRREGFACVQVADPATTTSGLRTRTELLDKRKYDRAHFYDRYDLDGDGVVRVFLPQPLCWLPGCVLFRCWRIVCLPCQVPPREFIFLVTLMYSCDFVCVSRLIPLRFVLARWWTLTAMVKSARTKKTTCVT